MTNYLRYQLKTLPEKSLGNWTFWVEPRACDNLQAAYWLYNITGDLLFLDFGKLIHKQSFSFVDMVNRGDLRRVNTIRCVNLAQGIKEPTIHYQQEPDKAYLDAVKRAFSDICQFHGRPQGMYSGDETLCASNPTQGSEFRSAVELTYSLEKMVEITGDIDFADHLERIAFNALSTQISDDLMTKQYFQQANQVMMTCYRRNLDQDHGGTDNCFGLLTGHPCCASGIHQGWLKFAQSLWYVAPDGGLAVTAYASSEVTAKVTEGCTVTFCEDTYYPMDDKISFTLQSMDKKRKEVNFALQLRIPKWCKQAGISVNSRLLQHVEGGRMAVIDRIWKKGDRVELHLLMEVTADTWYENSVVIERGPLVFALKMEERWEKKKFEEPWYGPYYYAVTPTEPWNYGPVDLNRSKANEYIRATIHPEKWSPIFLWNKEDTPIEMWMKARLISSWESYNEMAGPQPYSFCSGGEGPETEITLILYGCITLRVTEFPVVGVSHRLPQQTVIIKTI